MMNVETVEPLQHAEAMALFAVELQRNIELMTSLQPDDWGRRTVCPDWDVRELYLHVLGACEGGASFGEFAHQMRAARRRQKETGAALEAALSATQVAERQELAPRELVQRFAHVAPRVVRSRTRLPALLRKAPVKVDAPVVETWTLGYMVDTIYLRDAWMHRIDASDATDRPPVLTPEHDGRIVTDIVAEWARRHGQSFSLTLTGPAGGEFTVGSPAGEPMELDAVEFCRVLSGRVSAEGLLATVVPF
jgi:uncharacterized protein (TIGR03083 family)